MADGDNKRADLILQRANSDAELSVMLAKENTAKTAADEAQTQGQEPQGLESELPHEPPNHRLSRLVSLPIGCRLRQQRSRRRSSSMPRGLPVSLEGPGLVSRRPRSSTSPSSRSIRPSARSAMTVTLPQTKGLRLHRDPQVAARRGLRPRPHRPEGQGLRRGARRRTSRPISSCSAQRELSSTKQNLEKTQDQLAAEKIAREPRPRRRPRRRSPTCRRSPP